jgi:hypothetical protein
MAPKKTKKPDSPPIITFNDRPLTIRDMVGGVSIFGEVGAGKTKPEKKPKKKVSAAKRNKEITK